MKSLNDISPLLRGCVGISADLAPMRFPAETLSALQGTKFANIASCAAGIYLEFSTDAEEVSFSYSLGESVYVIHSGIDIYENGVFSAHFPVKPGDADVRIVYRRRESGRSELRIFFPAGAVFYPSGFSLGDAAPTQKREKLAVFYGSSSTQSAYIQHPSLSWPEKIAEVLGAECINRGIGSFYYDPSILPKQDALSPDYVFSLYGGNDVLHFPSLRDALAAAEEFVSALKSLYPSGRIFVLSPDYMRRVSMTDKMYSDLSEYSRALPDICARHDLTFLPVSGLISDLPELFCEDSVHFNLAGMGQFTGNLISRLQEYL